jgi:Rha family phage regulatory protein
MNEIEVVKKRVKIKDGKVFTTSLDVARVFDRRHKNVLRDIETLNVPEDFSRLNFEPVKYQDEKGEMRPMYNMTRDGFTVLVMGYTGKKAMKFKLAYIEAFNQMEQTITKGLLNIYQPLMTYLHNKELMEWRDKAYAHDVADFFSRCRTIKPKRFQYVMKLRQDGLLKQDAALLLGVSVRTLNRMEQCWQYIQKKYVVSMPDGWNLPYGPPPLMIGSVMNTLGISSKAVQ